MHAHTRARKHTRTDTHSHTHVPARAQTHARTRLVCALHGSCRSQAASLWAAGVALTAASDVRARTGSRCASSKYGTMPATPLATRMVVWTEATRMGYLPASLSAPATVSQGAWGTSSCGRRRPLRASALPRAGHARTASEQAVGAPAPARARRGRRASAGGRGLAGEPEAAHWQLELDPRSRHWHCPGRGCPVPSVPVARTHAHTAHTSHRKGH
jgi:hypothetical protein